MGGHRGKSATHALNRHKNPAKSSRAVHCDLPGHVQKNVFSLSSSKIGNAELRHSHAVSSASFNVALSVQFGVGSSSEQNPVSAALGLKNSEPCIYAILQSLPPHGKFSGVYLNRGIKRKQSHIPSLSKSTSLNVPPPPQVQRTAVRKLSYLLAIRSRYPYRKRRRQIRTNPPIFRLLADSCCCQSKIRLLATYRKCGGQRESGVLSLRLSP